MKKLFFLLTLGLSMFFVSCNKDNNDVVVANENVVGKWQVNALELFYNSGESEVQMYGELVGTGSQFMVLDGNGNGYMAVYFISDDGELIEDTVYFKYSVGEDKINFLVKNADGSEDNSHYCEVLDLTGNTMSIVPHPQDFVSANSNVTEIGYRLIKQ